MGGEVMPRAERSSPRAGLGPTAVALLLGVSALAGYVGYHAGTRQVASRVGDEVPLEVEPAYLDFGNTWLQDEFRWTMPIVNRSTERIEITNIMASCSCTSIEPTSLSLAPGETARIRLTLDLTTDNPKLAGLPERTFSQRVVAVIGGDSPRRRVWELRGVVRTPFSTPLPTVDFGESLIHGGPFPSRSVVVRCHQPSDVVEAECDGSLAKVSVVKQSDGGPGYEIRIAPRATLPVGRHEFKVLLSTFATSGDLKATVPLLVVAPVVYDIQCIPSYQHLGATRVGEPVERTFVLESRTGRQFRVEGAVADSQDLRVEPDEGPIPMDQEFKVTYRPSQPGPQSAQVSFFVRYQDAGAEGTATVTQRFMCHGVPTTKEDHPL